MVLTVDTKTLALDEVQASNLFDDLSNVADAINVLLQGDRSEQQVSEVLQLLNTVVDVYS